MNDNTQLASMSSSKNVKAVDFVAASDNEGGSGDNHES